MAVGIGNGWSNPDGSVSSALLHWQVSHSLRYALICEQALLQ